MRRVLIIYIVLSFGYFFYLVLKPLPVSEEQLVLSCLECDEYVNAMDFDSSQLLNREKEIIYNERLEYLKPLQSSEYKVPLAYGKYNWVSEDIEKYINDKDESSIDFSGHLFKDSNDIYHVFIEYEYLKRDVFFGNNVRGNFITFDTLDEYELYDYMKYEYIVKDDNQYEISSNRGHYYTERLFPSEDPFYFFGNTSEDYMVDKIIFSLKSFRQGMKPIPLKGFLWLTFKANDEVTSDSFDITIDLYESRYEEKLPVIIGLNGFNSSEQEEQYIPKRIKTTYVKGEI